MLGWLLSLCFCADELHILPLIFSLIIGLGFSAVFSSAWQCRGAAGSLWFEAKRATIACDGMGMGLDKKCRNLERASSYAGSSCSIGSWSHHRAGVFAPMGYFSIVPLNLHKTFLMPGVNFVTQVKTHNFLWFLMHNTTLTRIYAESNTLALLSKFIIGGIWVNSIGTGSAILQWVKRLKKNCITELYYFSSNYRMFFDLSTC